MAIQILDNPEKTPNPYARAILGAGQGYMGAQQAQKDQLMKQMQDQRKLQQEQSFERQMQQDKFGNESSKSKQDFLNDLKLQENKYEFEKELQKSKPNSEEFKEKEKKIVMKKGLDTVNRMRQIRKKGNLGIGTDAYSIFGGKTAKDAGEYSQLGKSLISLASTIPIRNQMEFETLSHKLYDPNITDSEAEGVLNAMERILKDSEEESSIPIISNQSNKERPPISSFNR